MSERTDAIKTGAVAPRSVTRPIVWAYLGALGATVIWSSNVVAVKFTLREIPAFPTGLLRITLAAATLALWHALHKKPFSIRAGERLSFVQLGVAGIAWSFLLFTLALSYTSVAHAVFLGALTPMAVLLLARLGGQERVTPLKLIGMLISLVGVLLLSLDQTGGLEASWKGDLLAIAGLWCFSFFTVRSKRLAPFYDSVSLNTYAFVFAALFCLPFLAWLAPGIAWSGISWVGWTSLLYSATIGSAGAYVAYYYSLRTLTASQVAAFQYVQPVLSTAFGVLFLAESWGAKFTVGAALILAGVFLAERR